MAGDPARAAEARQLQATVPHRPPVSLPYTVLHRRRRDRHVGHALRLHRRHSILLLQGARRDLRRRCVLGVRLGRGARALGRWSVRLLRAHIHEQYIIVLLLVSLLVLAKMIVLRRLDEMHAERGVRNGGRHIFVHGCISYDCLCRSSCASAASVGGRVSASGRRTSGGSCGSTSTLTSAPAPGWRWATCPRPTFVRADEGASRRRAAAYRGRAAVEAAHLHEYLRQRKYI